MGVVPLASDREQLSDREARAWTIAVDLSPGKTNGDYLLRDTERLRREWYEGHPKAWALTEVTPTKRGMNTVQDVEDTLMRCARAVGQADPDHTVEDFDVIGVVADMVEVYARENERLRETVEEMRAELAAAEPILVAADRVREACDAVSDGRDPGRLPDWERKSPLPADEGQASVDQSMAAESCPCTRFACPRCDALPSREQGQTETPENSDAPKEA